MPAKFLNAFADENPSLQKQIGCMAGIFQMFDCHHLLTGSRLGGHSHKKLTPGCALSNNDTFGDEHNACPKQFVLKKNLSKRLNETSPRASFSSSSCSSFSSVDCNKSTQQESPSFNQNIIPERLLTNSPRLKNSEYVSVPNGHHLCHDLPNISAKASQQSVQIRDLVKDSIYRDTRRVSTKQELKKIPKHRDSPRPMQLSKSMDGHAVNGKPSMHDNLNECLKILSKLKEAPWNSLESPRKLSEAKDDSFCSPKPPQFSYDRREVSRHSLDSRENIKSDTKLRELPRLSLDSRESTLRSSILVNRTNTLLKGLDSSEINERVSTSVVAKLMGLEAMPTLSSTSDKQLCLVRTDSKKDCDPLGGQTESGMLSKSSRPIQDSQQDRLSRSPKSAFKESIMQQANYHRSVLKPTSSSRIPVEAAPWKQKDGANVPQKTKVMCREAHIKRRRELVYSEIEKRLKQLELQQPSKDLRALKQILDAMQAKSLLLEAKGGENQLHKVSRQKNHSDQKNSESVHILVKERKNVRAYNSPIVDMKLTKSIKASYVTASTDLQSKSLSNPQRLRPSNATDRKKACTNSQMAKDHTSNTNFGDQVILSNSEKTRLHLLHASSRPQQSTMDNSGSPVRNSSSLSPRLRQRKLELEKKFSHPISPSNSDRPQRLSANKQSLDSVSPRCKLRLKPCQVLNNAARGDEIIQKQDSSKSASQLNEDVTREQCTQSPSGKAAISAASIVEQKKSLLSLKEDISIVDLPTIISEPQPSPISVLHASFYIDDSPPSFAMKISKAFKDNDNQAPDDCWTMADLPNMLPQKPSSEINHKNLGDIENLVQNHWKLASADGEYQITEQITLCGIQNPDHQYISEILVASGFLMKDFTSRPMNIMALQLHPSGRPINPDLFLVLEQTKPRLTSKKLHRKLVFDLVNEILAQNLELTNPGPCPDLFLPTKKIKDCTRGQGLLKELCTEIELLQAEKSNLNDENLRSAKDVHRQSKWWAALGSQVEVVLEIERSIFEDLIDKTMW